MATTGTTSLESKVGFRFHPTKEELINHYLKKKIQGHDFHDVIPEIDICSCEPWDLPGSDDDEWFYFSRPNYKSKGNNNRNRATKRGYWKITSREKVIKGRKSKAVIGKKRTLTFYKGKVRSGKKTSWVMHEYYIPTTLLSNTATQRDFVLCHLKKKDESTDIGAGDEVEPRTNDASDFGNPPALVHHGAGGPEENTQPEEIPSRASTESPQSDVYFSHIPRGNCLLANAGSANHIETDDDTLLTEFANSFLIDPFEEGTHATLNHSTVGEKLIGVAQGKHSRPVQQGQDSNILDRVFFEGGESSQNESSHFGFISQFEQLQSGGTGPSMPQKNHHYTLQWDAGTHSGSKGSFNVRKTSLISHRSYRSTVYLLMILITGAFLLYTLAGEFGSNGREKANLDSLFDPFQPQDYRKITYGEDNGASNDK